MKKLLATFLSIMLLAFGVIFPTTAFAEENSEYTPCKITRTFDYSDYGAHYINKMTLHYGVNGWQNIRDIEMTSSYKDYNTDHCKIVFEATVYVKRNSILDYCIKKDAGDLGVYWDNNDGKDYHISVSGETTPEN